MKRNGILVTGCPRSGTTWVGSILARAPGLVYIHEPFNPDQGTPYSPLAFPHQFLRVNSSNEHIYRPSVAATLGFYYNLQEALRQAVRHRTCRRTLQEIRRAFDTALRMKIHQLLGWWQPLVKDPIALLSADWLAAEFGLRPVVLIRHPGGFVSRALRNSSYLTPLRRLALQDEQSTELLGPYLADGEMSPLLHATAQWNMLNRVVAHFQDTQPDWIFFHYEDLALEPEASFRWLFGELGLRLTPTIVRLIAHYSAASNPVDPERPWELRRNSRAACYQWRNRLSEEQAEMVWTRTSHLASRWYKEDGVRV